MAHICGTLMAHIGLPFPRYLPKVCFVSLIVTVCSPGVQTLETPQENVRQIALKVTDTVCPN